MNNFVVAIIATYRRKNEVAELLDLLAETKDVGAVVVVDNAADPEVRAVTEEARVRADYVPLERNDGPGPARNRGMAHARKKWGAAVTHYWILDDDVRFAPDLLEHLLAALESNRAQFVAPLVTTPTGEIFAWPELKDAEARRFFASKDRNDPARFGDGVAHDRLPELSACGAVCYLMERICGDTEPVRDDFWLLGGDIEHSARIARRYRAVFSPHVAVEHYWGGPLEPASLPRSEYFRACAALQNNLFTLVHLLRTRFILRRFLGALKRFVRVHLRSREALYDFCAICWNAGVRGEGAGARSGQLLRARRSAYEPR